MENRFLIDAIVRQTMVLIAQLATASGSRAPLAHIANQVFLDLVRELQNVGLGQKIIADMFGMALRTYHERVQRLSESATDRGHTLWEAVLHHVQEQKTATRAAVLKRFRRDDPLMVRSVLTDLVDSGLVFRSGRGDQTHYRAADSAEFESVARNDAEVAATLVWVAVYRNSGCDAARLETLLGMPRADLDAALERLVVSGRIRRETREGGSTFACDHCVIPFDAAEGWEAAVFDHFQSVVNGITAKLHLATRAQIDDRVGGSTYRFDVWPGHPFEERVHSLLKRVREDASALREEVDAHNATLPNTAERESVTFYVGQSVPILPTEESES